MTEHVLAKNLRNAVLKFAFCGKLSERNNKDTLIALKSNFSKEEPFDIPDNWKWFNLGDLVWNRKQKKPNTKFSYIDIGSIDNMNQKLNDSENIVEPDKAPSRARKIVEKGDIIYSTVRPYLHNMAIIDKDFSYEPIASTGFAAMVCNEGVLNKYLFLYMKSPEFDKYANDSSNSKGVAYPAINDKTLYVAPIPLPPIEEQQRIVDKVDELMAKIDEYEKIENQLVELKKDFPTNMKYSILQASMQGELTERFISDTKVEIDNEFDSIDIEIPNEWKIAKYNSVCEINTGLTFNKSNQCQKSDSTLRVLRGGNINDNFEYVLKDDDVYVTYTDKYIRLKVGDVISPAVTSMEKMCKVGYIDKDLENTTAGGFVYIYRTKDTNILNPRFLMYFICSKFNKDMCIPNIHKSGQAFYNLKKSGLIQQPIVIPPIEEQQRIVDLLDKVLPLCNSLQEV